MAQPDHIRTGLFEFNPNRHDYSVKHFLGHTIEGRGFAEVEQALDILARQPATATILSRKIATYFMSDTPPDALVARMAQAFRATDGDIASVLLVMFKSARVRRLAAREEKYKDPMQFVLSAVRLAYDGKVILNTRPILGWLNRLAEGLYNHPTPDGYPMTAAAWNGPGQMAVRFEIARQIGSNPAGLFKAPPPDAVERPAFPQIANAFYFNALQPTLERLRRVPRSIRRPRRRNGTRCSCRRRNSCVEEVTMHRRDVLKGARRRSADDGRGARLGRPQGGHAHAGGVPARRL